MKDSLARASAASVPLFLLLAVSLRPGEPVFAGQPAVSAAAAEASGTSAARRDETSIDGTASVTITSSALKHWGIAGADAAFVPDSDSSRYARAIRAAANATALCTAIAQAVRADSVISTAPMDGDGDLEHRSGDEAQLALRLRVPGVATTTLGRLYICSRPVVAVVSRGRYPDERFQSAGDHRVRWISRRIALRPGEPAHVHLTASVDASQW